MLGLVITSAIIYYLYKTHFKWMTKNISFITKIQLKQNGGHFQPKQLIYSQVAEGGTLQMGIYKLFCGLLMHDMSRLI